MVLLVSLRERMYSVRISLNSAFSLFADALVGVIFP